MPKRVLTTGLAKVTLPPLPEIKTAESAPRTMMSAGGAGAAFGASGAPSLGGGGGGNGTAINFFGIRDISTSVVIMIDVSDSMFTRTGDASGRKLVRHGKDQNFQVIREEAIKLVQSLTPQTRFGIVRWSGGAYSWKAELVPATEENKQAAIAHIQGEVDYKNGKPKPGKPGGTRHDYALAEAFSLKPETIYMLTDGNATESQAGGGLKPIPPQEIYRVAEEGQKELTKKAHLHVIYYLNSQEKSDEVNMLRGLASRNSGKFQKVEAKGRKNVTIRFVHGFTDAGIGLPSSGSWFCAPSDFHAQSQSQRSRGRRTQVAQREIPQIRQRHLDCARARKGLARSRQTSSV